MNVVQLRLPGDPLSKDPPVHVKHLKRDPAEILDFKPAPHMPTGERLSRLMLLAELAVDWSLTQDDVLGFFTGRTVA